MSAAAGGGNAPFVAVPARSPVAAPHGQNRLGPVQGSGGSGSVVNAGIAAIFLGGRGG